MERNEEARKETVKITIEIPREQLNAILRHAVGLLKTLLAILKRGK